MDTNFCIAKKQDFTIIQKTKRNYKLKLEPNMKSTDLSYRKINPEILRVLLPKKCDS